MKLFPLALMVLLLTACNHSADDQKDHGNDPSPINKVAASDVDSGATDTTSTADDVASATTDSPASDEETSTASDATNDPPEKMNMFNVMHYANYQVTCFWIRNNNGNYAMSCLPDSQVTRTSENEATEIPK
jgi:hypothetical protein